MNSLIQLTLVKKMVVKWRLLPSLSSMLEKELNFLLNLWGYRSQLERKHSQSSNAAPSDTLSTIGRSSSLLCLSCKSKRGDAEKGLETPPLVILLIHPGQTPRNESVNRGVQLPFCCFDNAPSFAFLVIQCSHNNPSKLTSEPLYMKMRHLQLVPKAAFFVRNCSSSFFHSLLKHC